MKNLKGGDEVDAATLDPPTPGLTHRVFYNAPSRSHCWKCSRKPLVHGPENTSRKIAYMCKACNFAQDERAAIPSSQHINCTRCPHCNTLQDFETIWWHNPPLDWYTALTAVKRVRQFRRRGSGYPRALRFGGESIGMATEWFPMRLIPSQPICIRGFTHEDGSLSTNKETQLYTSQLMKEGENARVHRGRIFEADTDWNVAEAIVRDRHHRAVLRDSGRGPRACYARLVRDRRRQ